MPDEPITIRGGSLTVECDHRKKKLVDVGDRHRHPSQGDITHIDIRQGKFLLATVNIENADKDTEIEIHYKV